MRNLAGKIAFVTGAASGIGLGIATALAQAGMKVMLSDIDEPALNAAVANLRRTNADVDAVVADVTLKSDLAAAAEAVIARYGKAHILVSNAGAAGAGAYGTWNDKAWEWGIAVNLMSHVWGVEIFAPLIEQHGEGGHIISTASMAGLRSQESRSYNVTKYGVVALMEGLRNEMAPRGIGVSVLCPGYIRTGIINSAGKMPERFKPAGEEVPSFAMFSGAQAEAAKVTLDRLLNGIDPFYVGELVREAIEKNWLYILTDTEMEHEVDARFAAIKQGFDQIRGRTPRR